jgi:hypothetical protein
MGVVWIALAIFGNPATTLAILSAAAFISGLMVGNGMQAARINDLTRELDHRRGEIDRMAEYRRELESQIIKHRRSSGPTKPKNTKGKR